MNFKEKNTFEERRAEYERINNKYPTKIPVIIEREKNCVDLKQIDKIKFLIPKDITMGQLLYIVRTRVDLKPEKGLFLFIGNNIVTNSDVLSQIYESNKDKDGFLYVVYHSENTFG